MSAPAVILATALLFATQVVSAQQIDTDHDGLSDTLEQSLLIQFSPTFLVGRHDCSNIPAEFRPELRIPTPKQEDGTIYGQVFPITTVAGAPLEAEIHFYHLWTRDCGPHGHHLDTEHVAALVRQSFDGRWKAAYWYAAAHEDTVCDVSQITRARTLNAEDHGPKIWVSPGKHASYLNETLCKGGCGADLCVDMIPLPPGKLINLGEPAYPMNGSVFLFSKEWPLQFKMEHTNFPAAALARLDTFPADQIAFFKPGGNTTRKIIADGSFTESKLAAASNNTAGALSVADDSTGAALDRANISAGSALQKSAHKAGHALGSAYRGTIRALTPKQPDAAPTNIPQ